MSDFTFLNNNQIQADFEEVVEKTDYPHMTIGTVTTLPAGSDATVEITGTDDAPVLNFGIPQGIQGEQGVPGANGQDGQDGQDGRPGADPFAFTVTLPSANWSAGVQTISNANFLTDDYCYMVYASPSSTYEWQDSDVYADDVTTAGQMVFHCDVTPSVDLVANVIRLVVDT